MSLQKHGFHLVDPSPWPFFASLGAFTTVSGVTLYMHGFQAGFDTTLLGFSMVLYSMYVWWRDITREATFQGRHTSVVQTGLRSGMILFIVSEIMFFVAFFWAFFHSSLSPSIDIGAMWPPQGIEVLNCWGVPFVNTLILLTSGITVTWAHHAIVANQKNQTQNEVLISLGITILLAVFFTYLQYLEYSEATFGISDGVYGSTFYLATGFHGFHVFVGTIFLTVCLFRALFGHFQIHHHFGFEAAAWYWHFVDVVWLFLFVSMYWWSA